MMKKQWRTPIILGAALVLLAVVWLVSTLVTDAPDSTETTPSLPDVPLIYQARAADVNRIVVENESGRFALLPVETRENDGTVKINWTVEGYEEYPLAQATVNNVANLALILYGGRIIVEDAADLAPFGLEQPQTRMMVELKNGSTDTISFGNELASGFFEYAILNGTGPIYSVSSSFVARARSAVVDLLDKTALVGIEADQLTGLVLERSRDNLRLVASSTYSEAGESYLFAVEHPIVRPGDADRLNALTSEALNLQAANFVEINPADLSVYGLTAPRYSIKLIADDRTVTLRIGNNADANSFYMISDAVPAVFTVPADTFTTIDTPLVEMIDRLFALKSIWLVDRIKVNLPGAVFETEITMEKDQQADDAAALFTLNGKDAKIVSETGRSLFSAFYQRIIGMLIGGVDLEATPVNTRDGSITFYMGADPDSGTPPKTEVIEFARRDDYTYYVFINDTYTGFFINEDRTFTSDEIGSEGVVVAYKKLMYAIEHAVDGVFDTREGYQLN